MLKIVGYGIVILLALLLIKSGYEEGGIYTIVSILAGLFIIYKLALFSPLIAVIVLGVGLLVIYL